MFMGTQKKNDKIKKTPNVIVVIIMILVCAILMTIAFGVLFSEVKRQILNANIEAMEELALHDRNSIKNSVELRWDVMAGAEKRMKVRSWQSESEFIDALRDLMNNVPSVNKICMLDSEGTEYNSTGLIRENSYLKDICAKKSDRFAIRVNTEALFIENIQEVLMLGVPVDINVCGHRIEWMICQFPITTIESELKITSYNDEGFSSVVDEDGNYIINISRIHSFNTYDNFLEDFENAEFENYSDIEEIKAAATASDAVSTVYTLDGWENIMVITTIDFADWYFITTVPTAVFDTQTSSILQVVLFLLFVIAIVIAVVIVMMMRNRKEQMKLRISEAANQSKTEFLFNMSHDIRTPMNAILGYTDIGLRHVDNIEQSRANYKKIKTAGGHLLNLINDILEMSRIEAGKLLFTDVPLDMRKAMNGVILMSKSLATAKSLDFIVEMEEISNPFVYADELHINEVIINLISNAIKYTPAGGYVRYAAKQLNAPKNGIATYRFEIEDNGIGMSEEFKEHLFEAFSREESSGVSKIEGAGLGLSIVKRIVDMAEGSIIVNSKLGKGSTFIVDLPLKVMTDEEIAAFEEANKLDEDISAEEKFKGKRVLLVEDNEMNREIATEILTEAGLVVEEAEDGEIALQAVAEKGVEYFDFILMDIQMPVMNGFEATRAIRALQGGAGIPIIALSANAFEEDKKNSLDAGMNEHVAKPINVKELFETLSKFIK